MFISAHQLSKIYASDAGPQVVLDRLDFELGDKEVVVIIGRSGSGKSSFLNILGQMDLPTEGSVKYRGVDCAGWSEKERSRFRRQQVGFVFQRFNLIPTLSVEENVALPLELNANPDQARVHHLCGRLGVANLMHRYPDQLSGGEQQRIAIARALAHRPALVIADEPTGNLDKSNGRTVVEMLLEAVRSDGASLVMATHSEDMIGQADRVLALEEGRLVEADNR